MASATFFSTLGMLLEEQVWLVFSYLPLIPHHIPGFLLDASFLLLWNYCFEALGFAVVVSPGVIRCNGLLFFWCVLAWMMTTIGPD